MFGTDRRHQPHVPKAKQIARIALDGHLPEEPAQRARFPAGRHHA
jgi:hypothetical protein